MAVTPGVTVTATQADAESMGAIMSRWLIFSVVLGVFPVIAAVLWELLKTSGAPMDVSISHGQLFLPAVGICTASIGRLLGKSAGGASDVLGGGACIVLALIGTVLFIQVNQQASGLDPSRVVVFTIIFYVFSLVTGGSTIYSAERQ
jgi:hypothetical protein